MCLERDRGVDQFLLAILRDLGQEVPFGGSETAHSIKSGKRDHKKVSSKPLRGQRHAMQSRS